MKKKAKSRVQHIPFTMNEDLDRMIKPGLFQEKIDKGNAMLLGHDLPMLPGQTPGEEQS